MALSSQGFLGEQDPVIQGICSEYRIEICDELEHVKITCPDQEKAHSLDALLRPVFVLPEGYRLVISYCPGVSSGLEAG